MRNKLVALAGTLFLGLAAAGCSGMAQGSDGVGDDTMVQVQNHHSLLVSVEAISDGVDYNLGQVETAETRTFELPGAINDAYDLHVRIDPIGSPRTYVSDDILYTPGDLIRVEVESDIDLTTVTVR